ncbi:hypothetical protein DM01DRAFT_1405563 [Hesseltinella vesiculosa]|uniref:CENP-V/GFA domain-containing protein n=1 Tax=Hesseltinella vesiculosa TaxID=101127 RepID=A0A1X2GQA1_9FUNG|nr:hypothetical protein DM01DRAFT_1405563 [Hesseltinella vesiculosa]
MELQGSCHCGKTGFTVISHTPCPFAHCFCSICRKTDGGSGSAINIMGDYNTLKVRGKEFIKEYRAIRDPDTGELCGNMRYFCGECGCHLYGYCAEYKDCVYPLASAIDTPLPKVDPVKDSIYIMNDYRAEWVNIPAGAKHVFPQYPDISLHDWHVNNKRLIN